MSVTDTELQGAVDACSSALKSLGLMADKDTPDEHERLREDVYHYLVHRAWSPFGPRLSITERARLSVIEGVVVGAPMVAPALQPKRRAALVPGDAPRARKAKK